MEERKGMQVSQEARVGLRQERKIRRAPANGCVPECDLAPQDGLSSTGQAEHQVAAILEQSAAEYGIESEDPRGHTRKGRYLFTFVHGGPSYCLRLALSQHSAV